MFAHLLKSGTRPWAVFLYGWVAIWLLILSGPSVEAAEPPVVIWNSAGEAHSAELTDQSLHASHVWQISIPRTGPRANRPDFWLHLAGGGRLGVKNLHLENEQFLFSLSMGRGTGTGDEELAIDVGRIAGIQPFTPDASWRLDESHWARISRCRETEDLVLLKNGDRQLGELQGLTAKDVQLSGRLGDRTTPWPELLGLRMNPELAELPEQNGQNHWIIMLHDESWCLAQQLNLHADGWTVTLTNELNLKLSREQVAWLAPVTSHQIPLSHLPVREQSHKPLLGETTQVVLDLNILGLPLRGVPLRDLPSLSPLGVGLTSGMQATWQLEGRYERLACHLGLDSSSGKQGDAVVRFFEGARQIDEFQIQSGEPPVRVSLPLNQCPSLTIEVAYGPQGDVGDIVDLLHPVLFSKSP